MKIIRFLLLFVLVLANVPSVHAQGVPYIVGTTRPISAELRGWLDDWLAATPPSDAPYYIVTYWNERETDYFVSMVGVLLASPDEAWSLEDVEKTTWMGSVTVNKITGIVSPFSGPMGTGRKAPGLASMRTAAGGGSYVMFPFAQGSSAMYGPRGVHGSGDYGTSGMLFVDLVSGDDMGVTAAPPYVYAADAGEVDYVCDDGVTVAVRTHNGDTGDYFLYAHMLDNANLVEAHAFTQGELIGTLKYGTFEGGSPSCGWAEQHANHYHVHFGFVPSGGKYQIGSCILTISTQTWACGDETVRVGGYLVGGGGYTTPGNSTGTSGAGTSVNDPTFFDYVLAGVVGLVSRNIFSLLPSHQPFEYAYIAYNSVEMFFRLVFVLVQSNVSLQWVFVVLLYALTIKITMFAVSIIPLLFRAFKWLVPVA